MNTAPHPFILAPKAGRGSRPHYLSVVTLQQNRGSMPTSEELNGLLNAVATSGDRQAFAALFKHFAPRVKTYLMRAGSPESLAEDLVQETMVNVWRKAGTYNAGQAAASTWIVTIARNLRVDHFRRQSHVVDDGEDHDGHEMPDPAPAPDEQLHAQRLEGRVRAAMARLSTDQAQVLRLSFYEEQPHAAIAAALGIPLGTVKSRVRLAVNRLRRLLDGVES